SDVWVLEVTLPGTGGSRTRTRYTELPQHPAIERDLALLIAAAQPAEAAGDVIRKAGGALLEWVEPFDVYGGSGVAEGMRSIAWRLRFRAPDRTLTDDEVDAVIGRILVRLKEELGVQQRA